MTPVFPIIYRVTEDVPGLAPAGSFVWYDPRVHPSVRVVSFPFPNHGWILGLEMQGVLERCDGIILPQMPVDGPAESPAPRPAVPQPRPPLRAV